MTRDSVREFVLASGRASQCRTCRHGEAADFILEVIAEFEAHPTAAPQSVASLLEFLREEVGYRLKGTALANHLANCTGGRWEAIRARE